MQEKKETKLRKIRKMKNLSIKEVAKKMGWAENTLIQYELGYRKITMIRTLFRLCKALDCKPNELIG